MEEVEGQRAALEEEVGRKEEEAGALRAALTAREDQLRRLEEESAALRAQLSGEVSELTVCARVSVGVPLSGSTI